MKEKAHEKSRLKRTIEELRKALGELLSPQAPAYLPVPVPRDGGRPDFRRRK
jgi:hypothetical protein